MCLRHSQLPANRTGAVAARSNKTHTFLSPVKTTDFRTQLILDFHLRRPQILVNGWQRASLDPNRKAWAWIPKYCAREEQDIHFVTDRRDNFFIWLFFADM